MSDKKLVGFIGVGVMGGPMAKNLLAAGYPLVVFDRSEAATSALASLGAKVAASIKEVVDSAAVVFTSLPSPAILKEVALGAGGIAEGTAVKVVVDLSTVGSQTTKAVAAGLLARDIQTVDAPVSGGAAGASKGTLTIMVAGQAAPVAEVTPLLECLGKIFPVGDEAGQAQLLKLLNNMLSSTAFAITSEAYVAGVRGGLDPEIMMSVFNAGSGKNGATMDKFPKFVLPATYDFGFPISSVCKDIGLAVDECQALGLPMWVGTTVRTLWNMAAMADGQKRDMTELVKYVEHWSSADRLPD